MSDKPVKGITSEHPGRLITQVSEVLSPGELRNQRNLTGLVGSVILALKQGELLLLGLHQLGQGSERRSNASVNHLVGLSLGSDLGLLVGALGASWPNPVVVWRYRGPFGLL